MIPYERVSSVLLWEVIVLLGDNNGGGSSLKKGFSRVVHLEGNNFML